MMKILVRTLDFCNGNWRHSGNQGSHKTRRKMTGMYFAIFLKGLPGCLQTLGHESWECVLKAVLPVGG